MYFAMVKQVVTFEKNVNENSNNVKNNFSGRELKTQIQASCYSEPLNCLHYFVGLSSVFSKSKMRKQLSGF